MLSNRKTMMNSEEKNRGTSMCASCARQDGCVLTHQSSTNLYGCEEFESAQTMPETADYRSEMKTASALGLCATCESKQRCTLKATPGGVWHCEEFR
jgi:hypothetical protein